MPQYGVDIIGYNKSSLPHRTCAVQCKGKDVLYGKELTKSEVIEEIEKVREYCKLHQKLDEYIIATTGKVSAQVYEYESQFNEADESFALRILTWENIRERITSYSELMKKYYLTNIDEKKESNVQSHVLQMLSRLEDKITEKDKPSSIDGCIEFRGIRHRYVEGNLHIDVAIINQLSFAVWNIKLDVKLMDGKKKLLANGRFKLNLSTFGVLKAEETKIWTLQFHSNDIIVNDYEGGDYLIEANYTVER